MLPTDRQIQALHKKQAPSDEVFKLVSTHCQIVDEIAMQLLDTMKSGPTINRQFVHVGCLLHDIGVYPLLDKNGNLKENAHYIQHGIEGARILKAEVFSETILRFASHHTGTGIAKEDIERQNLPLPAGDYLAETPEELLVMYADKFHSKTTPPYFNSFVWYKRDVAKFGDDKVAAFENMAQQFGIPDLEPLAAKYGHEVRNA